MARKVRLRLPYPVGSSLPRKIPGHPGRLERHVRDLAQCEEARSLKAGLPIGHGRPAKRQRCACSSLPGMFGTPERDPRRYILPSAYLMGSGYRNEIATGICSLGDRHRGSRGPGVQFPHSGGIRKPESSLGCQGGPLRKCPAKANGLPAVMMGKIQLLIDIVIVNLDPHWRR